MNIGEFRDTRKYFFLPSGNTEMTRMTRAIDGGAIRDSKENGDDFFRVRER